MSVTFKLDGNHAELIPTLKAAKVINSMSGGYMNVIRNLGTLDHDTVVMVIAAGMNKKPSDVEDAVFNTGVKRLVEPAAEYITLLSNGGKKPDTE